MTWRAFDIPDDQTRLAAWLDEQLASHHLPMLVQELLALRDLPLDSPDPIELRKWLGNAHDRFLEIGTAALTDGQRRELLQRPWLLLALQTEIDAAESPYWANMSKRLPEVAAAVERGRQRLGLNVVERAPSIDVRRRTMILAAVGTAALLLIGLFAFRPPQKPTVAWGWNEQDLLTGAPDAAEYLNRLADAGAKWSKQRPTTKVDVSRRIQEMCTGCRRLIEANHKPLAPDEQAALRKLCEKWLGEFESVLAALEADQKTPLQARDAMDEIVNKLVNRLRSGSLT